MITRWAQGAALLLVVANFCSGAVPEGKYARQLQTECRELIADAVSRPYGIAWGEAPAVVRGGTAARPVVMSHSASPAAGLILLLAGELLNEQSLKDAAARSAAGVVAAQSPSGMIAPIALFGHSPDAHNIDTPFPDRSSTAAGMGLILAVLESQPTQDPELVKAVEAASKWLREQQISPEGGWARAEADGSQSVRLDESDYRNCTIVKLLEAAVLNSDSARTAAGLALQHLRRLQLNDVSDLLPTAQLWTTQYDFEGVPMSKDDRPAVDFLASRYALQAMLAGAVVLQERGSVAELTRVAQRIEQLRRPDGNWGHFETSRGTNDVGGAGADFGLPNVLRSAAAMKNLGPDRYLQLLNRGWRVNAQLAATVVGLTDDPLSLSWPVARSEVAGYIERRASEWKTLDSPPPVQLQQRTARLWLLLQRAKLEQMQ